MKILKILTLSIFSITLCNSCNNFNPGKSTILDIKNNNDNIIHQDENIVFKFDKVVHPDYDFLFDSILNPKMSKRWGKDWQKDKTWTKATKIRIWVREYLDNKGWIEQNKWQGEYKNELVSIRTILKNNQSGKDGLCSYYATFYMHCCLVSGINNRRIGWWHPGGDQLNEVYDPEYQKWVAVSPLYNCWFTDKDKTPLSLLELNKYKHDENLNLLVTQRDYQTSYPKPELFGKNWLLRYSWDIYYWKKNGNLMFKDLTGIRYRNQDYWPYRFFKAKYINEYTSDEDVINFDVASINIKAEIKKNQLKIEVIDFSIINFKEFICEIYDYKGEIIDSVSFENKSTYYDIENLNKRQIYTATIFGRNTRNGETNKVQISFKKN
ncbi:hypothetical protein [uncultured Maribacter sp.]|uniref:hypothetical protein n=1 Tax=uncultured Maribacter sp. TaxID=431308 RepID=UPI00262E2E89|nr:hypothetical protein [uncultured Maribacter sp.]